jgi:hypothetical protein
MSEAKTILGEIGLFFKTMFSSEIRDRVSGCCASQSEEVLQERIKRESQREKQNRAKQN